MRRFTLEFADETQKVLTYDNAKVIGSAVLEAKAGATWSNVLYSEDDAAERGEFILSADGETHYSVAYNPATNTLSIDFAVPAVPATVKAVKYAGAKQGSFELKDGKYEAMVELGAWNRISFVVVGEDDSEVALWYVFGGLFEIHIDGYLVADAHDGLLLGCHRGDDE